MGTMGPPRVPEGREMGPMGPPGPQRVGLKGWLLLAGVEAEGVVIIGRVGAGWVRGRGNGSGGAETSTVVLHGSRCDSDFRLFGVKK